MGLSHWLARAAVAGPHLLVVEAPGAWSVRVAVEREAARRGWSMAHAPADADVLAVCGDSLGEQDQEAVGAVWEQMPGPRARVHISHVGPPGLAAAFEQAAAQLLDGAAQREEASCEKPERGETTHGQPTTAAWTTAAWTWRARAVSLWPRAGVTATVWTWTFCTCRWVRCCRTGRPG